MAGVVLVCTCTRAEPSLSPGAEARATCGARAGRGDKTTRPAPDEAREVHTPLRSLTRVNPFFSNGKPGIAPPAATLGNYFRKSTKVGY